MLQRLSVLPLGRQRDSEFRLQLPGSRGNHHGRTQLHLQRNQVLPPVQHQPVWGRGTHTHAHTHTQTPRSIPLPPCSVPTPCLLPSGREGRVHRQRDGHIRPQLPDRRTGQCREDFHLPIDDHPRQWEGLEHGSLLPVHQSSGHLPRSVHDRRTHTHTHTRPHRWIHACVCVCCSCRSYSGEYPG